MVLKPGAKLKSAVCEAQFVVVRAPEGDVDVACGGMPLVAADADTTDAVAVDPAFAEGSLIGKRYANEEVGLELLCTRAGEGSLSCNGEAVGIKGAKPLPASD